jgi:hypothetical protein
VSRTSNHILELLVALSLALFLQCVAAPRAWAQAETPAPEVTARAWALIDLNLVAGYPPMPRIIVNIR